MKSCSLDTPLDRAVLLPSGTWVVSSMNSGTRMSTKLPLRCRMFAVSVLHQSISTEVDQAVADLRESGVRVGDHLGDVL